MDTSYLREMNGVSTPRGGGAVRIYTINFEELFRRTVLPEVLNYFAIDYAGSADAVSAMICGKPTGNIIKNYASCYCGKTIYGYRKNQRCPVCKTEVKSPFSSVFESRTWIKVPDGVSPFIHPGVWDAFGNLFKRNKIYSFLDWLVRHGNKDVPAREAAVFRDYYSMIGSPPRNWNYVSDHFEDIIYRIQRHTDLGKEVTKEEIDAVFEYCGPFLRTRYLPMAHPSVYALESGSSQDMIYADCGLSPVAEVGRMFSGIETALSNYSLVQYQNKVASAVVKLSQLFVKQTNANSKKEGPIRQGLTSTRCHFTIRAVIVGWCEDVQYDSINVAWSHAIHMLEYHLLNHMLKEDWGQREAIEHIHAHELKYCPIIDRLFQKILSDAGPKGYPCYFIRYPSLSNMSIAMVYIARVKTDVMDHSTDIPLPTVRPFNADFDGDQMLIGLLLDRYMQRGFMPLEHHTKIWNASQPDTLEDTFAMSAQLTLNFQGMLEDDEFPLNPLDMVGDLYEVQFARESINFLESLPQA